MKNGNNDFEKNIKKSSTRLGVWTLFWVLTLALASLGPKLIWDFNTALSVSAILVNTAVGVAMILANMKYIQQLDEMQRKLNLEAMAIALGVAIVGGLAYSTLDVANVISFDAEISYLVMLIGITYSIGLLIGNLRYK